MVNRVVSRPRRKGYRRSTCCTAPDKTSSGEGHTLVVFLPMERLPYSLLPWQSEVECRDAKTGNSICCKERWT